MYSRSFVCNALQRRSGGTDCNCVTFGFRTKNRRTANGVCGTSITTKPAVPVFACRSTLGRTARRDNIRLSSRQNVTAFHRRPSSSSNCPPAKRTSIAKRIDCVPSSEENRSDIGAGAMSSLRTIPIASCAAAGNALDGHVWTADIRGADPRMKQRVACRAAIKAMGRTQE